MVRSLLIPHHHIWYSKINRLPIFLILLLACGSAITDVRASNHSAPAITADPVQTMGIRTVLNPIPNRYIVVYKETNFFDPGVSFNKFRAGVESLNAELARRHKGNIRAQWNHAVAGMAISMSSQAAAELAKDPRVAFIEQDALVQANSVQTPATWGLDRIDQRDLPLDNRYLYQNDGGLVTAYVIDTGIRTTHQEFGGRASWGVNFADDGNDTDCNGHGTHVAGTLGGSTYGTAKKVSLVAVKVLNCIGNGTYAGLISAIDWILANKRLPAVANMSLSGGYSSAANAAISKAIAGGIPVVVAAGNDGMNACDYSPASAPEAITVGATTNTDQRSSFSNTGPCLDLFAPGSNITSATNSSNTSIGIMSGTSMASPHVAGAVAMLLNDNPSVSPAELSNLIIANSSLDKVNNPGTQSPNRLLFSGNLISNYKLNINSIGAANVPISANPVVYAGTTPYSKSNIPDSTEVTLVAPNAVGSAVFISWTGCNSSVGANCTLKITSDRTISVNYTTPNFTLFVNSAGISNVAISTNPSSYGGSTNYSKTQIPYGSEITLTAPNRVGSANFDNWSGCKITSETTCTVLMSANQTVTANYATPASYSLSVNSSGTPRLPINAVPQQYAGITNYRIDGIEAGTGITLTAPATEGNNQFLRWSGCDSVSETTCTLRISGDKAVNAIYMNPNLAQPSRGSWRVILD